MKKLLLGAAIVLSAIFSANAQTTIVSTTFASTIPGGWTQQKTTVNGGWKFGTSFGSNLQANAPAQGDDAYVDDWDGGDYPGEVAGWDTLYTSSMNCAAYAHVFLSMNYMFWQDDGQETSNVLVSNDGGASWHVAGSLQNTGGGWANGAIFDLSTWAGGQANVMLAYTYYNGNSTHNTYIATGMGIESPLVYAPVNYNVQVMSQNLPSLMQVGKAYTFSGVADNFGGDSIVAMTMNYYVNSPSNTKSDNITGIVGFNGATGYNWIMSTQPFTPGAPGLYTIKYWATPLNTTFTNTNTDTLVAKFWAVDSVKPRQAIYEEFTGQSCVFCMLAAPNMDSTFDNDQASSNIIRYHVPIPARDFMYVANNAPVDTRESYYGITGAPAGYMDGTSLYPGADYGPPAQRYSSTTIQADNAVGSPIKIDITSAKYISASDSFYVSANITAYAAFAAGLKAQVALTIDSITYKYDLSMDDPAQEFATCTCIPGSAGSNCCSYADAPDRYYDFVLKYTHVAEEMFPNNGAGTSLAPFTSGQTQTISFGWKKNHPWGLYDKGAQRDSDMYDSSASGQFVVFVQTNSAISGDNVPAKYVFQSASKNFGGGLTSMQEITSGVYFKMYPNPATNSTNLALDLNKEQTVSVEVYNLLGEKVYSSNQGTMSAGQHIITVNSSEFPTGIYEVRIIADNIPSSTSKLVITR